MTYNGWKNYETWNVALWIYNESKLYDIAKRCNNYSEFLEYMDQEGTNSLTNGDGVNYWDPILNIKELDEIIFEAK